MLRIEVNFKIGSRQITSVPLAIEAEQTPALRAASAIRKAILRVMLEEKEALVSYVSKTNAVENVAVSRSAETPSYSEERLSERLGVLGEFVSQVVSKTMSSRSAEGRAIIRELDGAWVNGVLSGIYGKGEYSDINRHNAMSIIKRLLREISPLFMKNPEVKEGLRIIRNELEIPVKQYRPFGGHLVITRRPEPKASARTGQTVQTAQVTG